MGRRRRGGKVIEGSWTLEEREKEKRARVRTTHKDPEVEQTGSGENSEAFSDSPELVEGRGEDILRRRKEEQVRRVVFVSAKVREAKRVSSIRTRRTIRLFLLPPSLLPVWYIRLTIQPERGLSIQWRKVRNESDTRVKDRRRGIASSLIPLSPLLFILLRSLAPFPAPLSPLQPLSLSFLAHSIVKKK